MLATKPGSRQSPERLGICQMRFSKPGYPEFVRRHCQSPDIRALSNPLRQTTDFFRISADSCHISTEKIYPKQLFLLHVETELRDCTHNKTAIRALKSKSTTGNIKIISI